MVGTLFASLGIDPSPALQNQVPTLLYLMDYLYLHLDLLMVNLYFHLHLLMLTFYQKFNIIIIIIDSNINDSSLKLAK